MKKSKPFRSKGPIKLQLETNRLEERVRQLEEKIEILEVDYHQRKFKETFQDQNDV